MRGDLPADLLEEVPGELPTTAPMATAMVTPAVPPVRQVAAPAQVPPLFCPLGAPLGAGLGSGQLGSACRGGPAPTASPYWDVLPPRTGPGTGKFVNAAAFLGRAPELLEPPPEARGGAATATAKWLLGQRRAEAALRLLPLSTDPEALEAATLRLRCLAMLRRYRAASEELATVAPILGDGTPFEARLLAARLPMLLNSADAFQSMGLLLQLAQQIQQGMLVGSGEGGSVTIGERLQLFQLLSHAALAAGHGGVAASAMLAAARTGADGAGELYAALGRHYTAAGNVKAATEAFRLASKAGRQEDTVSARLDRGLLAVACSDYKGARAHFEAAADTAAEAIAGAGALNAASVIVDEAVSAESNLAVCQLYLCRLREGVRRLEALVKRDPVLYLRQSVAQNLSALYEFLPDVKQRRMVLLEILEAYQLGDVEARFIEQPT